MPAYGVLNILNRQQISDVAHYVLSLSMVEHDEEAAARGQETYMTQCAACHMPNGDGNPLLLWYAGEGRIDYASDIAGRSDRQTAFAEEGERQGLADMTLATGPFGELAILWQQSSQVLTDLRTAIFDPAMNTWGEPFDITADDAQEVLGAAAFTEGGDFVAAYNKFQTVYTDASATEIDGVIYDLGTIPERGQADLTIIRRPGGADPHGDTLEAGPP